MCGRWGVSKSRWEPWVVVHKGTLEPIVPVDSNPGHRGGDEGMLVYRTEAAAKMAAKHQHELYEVKAGVARLSAVIIHESNVVGKIAPSKPESKAKGRAIIGHRIGGVP